MDYTVEIYRLDKRVKGGMKLVSKMDYTCDDIRVIEQDWPVRPRYVRFIKETYVTRKNLMTGAEYKERYDTPLSCSPSSETFWSM